MFGDYFRSMIPIPDIRQWKSRAPVVLCFLVVMCLCSVAISPSLLFGQSLIEQGNKEFINKNYSLALDYYRKHLRSNPKDFEVWSLLGASYYHVGQVRRSLKALRKANPHTKNQSQNMYYQGIGYDALGQPNRARRYLVFAANFKDPFGALAMIELAGMEYDERNFKRTRYWAKRYLKQFPDGSYQSAMKDLLAKVKQGQYIPLSYTQRRQYQVSQFTNHRLSLYDKPHFWIFQAGADYATGTRSNPAIQDQMPVVETGAGFEETAINLLAGFGLGPIQREDTAITLGYIYVQDWFTNSERIAVYFEDLSDFNYFPYRPDLQERHHKLFGEVVTAIAPKWDLGLYGHIQVTRSGSSLYPAPERPEIRQAIDVSQESSVIPWMAWRISNKHQLKFYLTLNKTIDLEQDANSKQTYSFFSSKDPFVSFGLGYNGLYLSKTLTFYSELYQYRLLTNNYWDEYERFGLYVSAKYRLTPEWHFLLKGSYYQDDYIYDQIKSGSCEFGEGASISVEGVTCPRTDQGLWLQAGITLRPSPHDAWSAYAGLKNHTNEQLKVYDEQRYEVYFQYTLAFPSVERGSQYLNYYEGSLNRREAF
ncbi:tetratricopeptide repeat protein [Pseudobacteriovorax antillogorgiicola]|nr:tetratricopeptide repeat protein [Pseudobacteriovorax antillogorgiicola]